ncbi:dihydrofolate reductase family protein [Paenibacillaceae bacterium WGS1546]|uniref:dihydrofolate reductase family protein n=1 Tax=Cohnella sp. WGS1546 TaxID=3366810 RepID=UPI00372D235F
MGERRTNSSSLRSTSARRTSICIFTDGIRSADAIVFGRTTYELMADYWPTEAARKNDPMIADLMNRLPKIVFSATLRTVDWQPSMLAQGDLAEEIGRLKARYARDLVVLGSGILVAALSARDLVDEYQLVVNPVVLGRGRPFQQQLNANTKLELASSKAFRSGNARLCYRPCRNEITS